MKMGHVSLENFAHAMKEALWRGLKSYIFCFSLSAVCYGIFAFLVVLVVLGDSPIDFLYDPKGLTFFLIGLYLWQVVYQVLVAPWLYLSDMQSERKQGTWFSKVIIGAIYSVLGTVLAYLRIPGAFQLLAPVYYLCIVQVQSGLNDSTQIFSTIKSLFSAFFVPWIAFLYGIIVCELFLPIASLQSPNSLGIAWLLIGTFLFLIVQYVGSAYVVALYQLYNKQY